MREILYKLRLNGENVGYEWHQDGKILHGKGYIAGNAVAPDPGEHSHYIKHDSKDQYIGRKLIDGGLIFENDNVMYERECIKTHKVEWVDNNAAFMLGSDEIGDNIKFIKIVGIEGVN